MEENKQTDNEQTFNFEALDKCRDSALEAFDNLLESIDCPEIAHASCIAVLTVLIGRTASRFFHEVEKDEFELFLKRIFRQYVKTSTLKKEVEASGIEVTGENAEQILKFLKGLKPENMKAEIYES